MTASRIHINQKDQYSAEVMVNGRDLAGILAGYHVRADRESGPQVVLQFSSGILPEFEGLAEVVVAEDLREALVHLGWREPSGPDVTEREVTALGHEDRLILRSDGTYRTEPWHASREPEIPDVVPIKPDPWIGETRR